MEFTEFFDTLTEVLDYKDLADRVYSEVNLSFGFDYSLTFIGQDIFYKVVIVIYGKKGTEKKQSKL